MQSVCVHASLKYYEEDKWKAIEDVTVEVGKGRTIEAATILVMMEGKVVKVRVLVGGEDGSEKGRKEIEIRGDIGVKGEENRRIIRVEKGQGVYEFKEIQSDAGRGGERGGG